MPLRVGEPRGWGCLRGGQGGGHGPDRCLGREERRPSNPWKGWLPPDETGQGVPRMMWDHCTP